MDRALRFRINTSKVVHEAFDDEVVIISFDSGNYYSLDTVGADIWSLIQSSAGVSEIIEEITRRYEGGRVDIENAVNLFMSELQQENLVLPDQREEAGTTKGPDRQVEHPLETEKLNFQAPVLHKYKDMQELLLLAPIHEVDEPGWPKAKPDSSENQ